MRLKCRPSNQIREPSHDASVVGRKRRNSSKTQWLMLQIRGWSDGCVTHLPTLWVIKFRWKPAKHILYESSISSRSSFEKISTFPKRTLNHVVCCNTEKKCFSGGFVHPDSRRLPMRFTQDNIATGKPRCQLSEHNFVGSKRWRKPLWL